MQALIGITLIAASLAFVQVTSGIGILGLLFVGPDIVRTALIASQESPGDQRMIRRITIFLGSLYIISISLIATWVACVVTCLPLSQMVGEPLIGGVSKTNVPYVCGALAACIVGAVVLWSLWRRKE